MPFKKDCQEYSVYRAMIYGCYPSGNVSTYYERNGIGVCDRWKEEGGFWAFLEDMGTRPSEDHRIKRIDPLLDFSPSNCVWSDEKPHGIKHDILLTYNNKTQCLRDWCKELDLNYSTAYKRYRRGENTKKILSKSKVILTYKGKEYSVSEASKEFGLSRATIYYRIREEWEDEDILGTPVNEIPVSLRTEDNVKYGRYSSFLAPFFDKNNKL